MNIHALRNVINGVYMIDPLQIPNYEYMLAALLNGLSIDSKENDNDFKSFIQDAVLGQTTNAAGDAPQATQIAVHQQRGIMLRDSMGCGHIGTREVGNRLLRYDANEEVMAQIIIFDTPGGGANSSVEIADAIAKCTKPVYAWVDGMCCSAGIYSASYCKEIFAHRDTDCIGSIGTYARYTGRKNGEANANGEYTYEVYATNSENKNFEYRELIEKGNDSPIKAEVDKHRNRFVKDILANRPNATEKDHCHGNTWDASEVVDSLIDGIKPWSELIDHIVSEYKKTNSSGGASSTSNSNNKNHKPMKDLTVLAAVLASAGLQDLETDNDGDLNLTSEQLTALNSALATYNSTDVSAIEAERDSAITARETAEEAQSNAEAALVTANEEIAELKEATPAGSAGSTPPGESGKGHHQSNQEAMADAAAIIKEIEG